VHVGVADVRPAAGSWRTKWLIGNDGRADLALTRIHAPHRRYRADPRALDIAIGPDQTTALDLDLRVDAAGGEIENAFLILTLGSGASAWRILTRLRVRMDGGIPWPLVERIDVQEVGFSGSG